MRLRGQLLPIAELSLPQRQAMLDLMTRYYANVSPEKFHADLAEKHWVILLWDRRNGQLCGFSTQGLYPAEVAGQQVLTLFSGDTIVRPEHWGDVALAHIWGRLAISLIDRHPQTRLYWFLIAKGFRTYRFLPVFFHEFYPRYDLPTPPSAAELLNVLGRGRFASVYDATTGLLRANAAKDYLKPGVSDLTAERLADPHVRYFAQRNPGHARGDELCCLAPLTRENFTRAAWRVIEAGGGSV